MLDVLQDASAADLTRSVGRGWSSPTPRLSPLTRVSPGHIPTPAHPVLPPQGLCAALGPVLLRGAAMVLG